MIETIAKNLKATVVKGLKETAIKLTESAVQSSMEIIENSSLESLKAQNELSAYLLHHQCLIKKEMMSL